MSHQGSERVRGERKERKGKRGGWKTHSLMRACARILDSGKVPFPHLISSGARERGGEKGRRGKGGGGRRGSRAARSRLILSSARASHSSCDGKEGEKKKGGRVAVAALFAQWAGLPRTLIETPSKGRGKERNRSAHVFSFSLSRPATGTCG